MWRILAFCLIFAVICGCSESDLGTPEGEVYLDLEEKYTYKDTSLEPRANDVAVLGRVLFYDPQLSLNNTISCASCHKQEAAFSDNRRFSAGYEGKLTSRNSMPLQNLSTVSATLASFASLEKPTNGFIGQFNTHFFWDGREGNLENLILQPVGNHIEMGITNINDLAKKLSALPYYQPLFESAFGDDRVDSERISKAITSFISTIETTRTGFDLFNSVRIPMSSLQTEGMHLFQTKYDCNSCHRVESPIGYQFAGTFSNIGLDPVYNDPGLEDESGLRTDAGKFKIPSLRNISFTAPYMHDGRFETLDDVMEHYSTGIADHPNLDDRLKNNDGSARKMNITKHEKEAIIAFLRTLDDQTILQDPKFSNPFKLR